MKTNKGWLMKLHYDEVLDTFELLSSIDGGKTWDFNCSVKCHHLDKDPAGERNGVHFSILKELQRGASYGYKLIH